MTISRTTQPGQTPESRGQDKPLLRSRAGLSLLAKALNGQALGEPERQVAQQMAEQAVRQRSGKR